MKGNESENDDGPPGLAGWESDDELGKEMLAAKALGDDTQVDSDSEDDGTFGVAELGEPTEAEILHLVASGRSPDPLRCGDPVGTPAAWDAAIRAWQTRKD